MNKDQQTAITEFIAGKEQPTGHVITSRYLSNLIRNQVKDYSNEQLIYTSLIKDKFLEVLDTPNITAEERVALITWTTYIFGGEDQVPLSLVLIRCNSLVHMV